MIFCPYSAGLQQFLRICSKYSIDFVIKNNGNMSNMIIVGSKEERKSAFTNFLLSGIFLKNCNKIKYLGHLYYLNIDLSDNKDRQCWKLYA